MNFFDLQTFDDFKNLYIAKHSGRVLALHPGYGTAELSITFPSHDREVAPGEDPDGTAEDRKHIVCVNTYQMVLLLMFNTR